MEAATMTTAVSAGAGTLIGGGLSGWFVKLAINRWLAVEDAFKIDVRKFIEECTHRLETMKQQDALLEKNLALTDREQQLRMAEIVRRFDELRSDVDRDHARLGKIEPEQRHLLERVEALETLFNRRKHGNDDA